MSAAIAQECVICHVSSSKYKCPTCRSPTCSLKCSKQHATQEHTSQSSPSNGSVEKHINEELEAAPPLKIRDEVLPEPSPNRFGKVDKYVSMKDYDSTQFLEDLEYLQYVGKCVGMLGKDIVKNGWLKEMEERAASHQANQQHQQQGTQRSQSNGRGRGGMSNGSGRQNQNVPAEIKSRMNLESWIRKMKLPIMLVPNGMTWRKENQTWWKNNTRELFCTVEIKTASVKSFPNDRSLLHRISWDKTISSIVAKDLEKRLKQRRNSAVESSIEIMSLLEEHCDEKGRLNSDKWQGSLCVTVDVVNDRLRNESSSKFLEWWQRQVKNGMVKADGLELDEEKRRALDEVRRGTWGEIEGIESTLSNKATEKGMKGAETQPIVETESMQADAGLISSSILAKIQAARAKRLEEDAAAQKAEEVIIPQGPKRKAIVLEGKETFQDVLRYMPNGYGIVEYFHLQIWERGKLTKEIKNGNVIKIDLEGREDSVADATAELRKRALETQEARQMAAKKAKLEPSTPSNALSNLNAYDTSSDEDEDMIGLEHGEQSISDGEADLESDIASIPAMLGGLAEIARSLGMVTSA